MIRAVTESDIVDIVRIYNYYVLNTVITFETQAVSNQEMSIRVNNNLKDELPWLVAENEKGEVLGYAYASKWKGRCAYKYSVEITVYLDNKVKTKGWGTKLYNQLFEFLQHNGFHAAITGISLPNDASIALHEKSGINKVTHFEQVGHKFEQWVDVGYWQCLINNEI